MYEYDDLFTNMYLTSWDEYDQTQLQQAKTQAGIKGDKLWEKILNGVIKYGDPFLTMLTKNGIIPNKNLQSVLKAQYDQNALAQLIAANGGSIDKAPSQIVDRSANILGLSTSTWILIGAAILFFMLSKNK
ncbi:hypothetical protein [Emticicia fontis]